MPPQFSSRRTSSGIWANFIHPLCLLCLIPAAACTRALPTRTDKADSASRVFYQDGVGRQVGLPRHPQRIISLAPSVTELIFLLGAGDRLIGVTTHCDWPEAARGIPKIGDLLNPNYEVILAARPDVIIGSTAGNDKSAIFKLADLGLPVYVTAPRSAAKIFETVRMMGQLLDCPAEAKNLVSQMQNRLDAVQQRLASLPRTRAFFITWFDPLLAPGKHTFETDVLRYGGIDSITANIDEFYPRYSLEELVRQDPDVIITVEHTGHPLPDLKNMPGWQHLKAVRSGRIYVLSEVFQHPSPRFVDGVEELARRLHPERFP